MAEIILSKIQIKRGLKSNLPMLDNGEPAYCTDTKEFFVGTSTGNVLINDFSSVLEQLSNIAQQINDLQLQIDALQNGQIITQIAYNGGDFTTNTFDKIVCGGNFIN